MANEANRRRKLIAFWSVFVLCVAIFFASGAWLIWRAYCSGDQLLAAVKRRDHAAVLRLLSLGADVQSRADAGEGGPSDAGGTPLHYAVSSGQVDMVRALVESGADVNAASAIGVTPLHLALTFFKPVDMDIVKLLIDAGSDVNARIHDEPYIRVRIDRGGLHLFVALNGWTPLHYAAYGNNMEAVVVLLKAGADPEIKDIYSKRTPLQWAEAFEYQGVVEALSAHTSKATQITPQASLPCR